MKSIKNVELKNKNILLAIGSRFLKSTASYYQMFGANVYTRVLPTPESISNAFSSGIKNSNIAVLEPSKKRLINLEQKLCDFWQIDYLLCRESGGYAQMIWEQIALKNKLKLFLVKRPKFKHDFNYVFFTHEQIIKKIINSNI